MYIKGHRQIPEINFEHQAQFLKGVFADYSSPRIDGEDEFKGVRAKLLSDRTIEQPSDWKMIALILENGIRNFLSVIRSILKQVSPVAGAIVESIEAFFFRIHEWILEHRQLRKEGQALKTNMERVFGSQPVSAKNKAKDRLNYSLDTLKTAITVTLAIAGLVLQINDLPEAVHQGMTVAALALAATLTVLLIKWGFDAWNKAQASRSLEVKAKQAIERYGNGDSAISGPKSTKLFFKSVSQSVLQNQMQKHKFFETALFGVICLLATATPFALGFVSEFFKAEAATEAFQLTQLILSCPMELGPIKFSATETGVTIALVCYWFAYAGRLTKNQLAADASRRKHADGDLEKDQGAFYKSIETDSRAAVLLLLDQLVKELPDVDKHTRGPQVSVASNEAWLFLKNLTDEAVSKTLSETLSEKLSKPIGTGEGRASSFSELNAKQQEAFISYLAGQLNLSFTVSDPAIAAESP